MSRPRALLCVFNPIEYDGRVQRSATGLAAHFDVDVLTVDGAREFADPAYRVSAVTLPARGSKYVAHLRFAWRLCSSALRRRTAVVYGHDYFMALPGWLAARLSGARFVYDAHELIVPEPGERLAWRERIWYWLERAVVRRAELVVAANIERAEYMREHYRLAATPLVVRNIAAPPAPRLADAEVLARYPELRRTSPQELLVVYQGDMSLLRGLGVFLDAAALLPAHVRIVLVGGGPDHSAIAARAAEPQLRGRVSVVGRVPRDNLYDLLRHCDIGLISYPMEGLNNVYCAPNKIFEYAQAGLPMVTTAQPPLRDALGRFGIGEVVEPTPGQPGGSAAAWAEAITRVSTDIEAYRERLPAFLAAHRWTDDHARLLAALAGSADAGTDVPAERFQQVG